MKKNTIKRILLVLLFVIVAIVANNHFYPNLSERECEYIYALVSSISSKKVDYLPEKELYRYLPKIKKIYYLYGGVFCEFFDSCSASFWEKIKYAPESFYSQHKIVKGLLVTPCIEKTIIDDCPNDNSCLSLIDKHIAYAEFQFLAPSINGIKWSIQRAIEANYFTDYHDMIEEIIANNTAYKLAAYPMKENKNCKNLQLTIPFDNLFFSKFEDCFCIIEGVNLQNITDEDLSIIYYYENPYKTQDIKIMSYSISLSKVNIQNNCCIIRFPFNRFESTYLNKVAIMFNGINNTSSINLFFL